MGARRRRYVGKAVPGQGWRVWDTLLRRWWGRVFPTHPDTLLAELNGDKTLEKIIDLSKVSRPPRVEEKRAQKKTREPAKLRKGGGKRRSRSRLASIQEDEECAYRDYSEQVRLDPWKPRWVKLPMRLHGRGADGCAK